MSSCGHISNVQRHTGLTYIFNFWHSGTLALSPERQSARMSEIKKNGLGQACMAQCNNLKNWVLKG